jgi:transketolase
LKRTAKKIVILGTSVHDALETTALLKDRVTMDIFALSSIRPFAGDVLADSVRKTGCVLSVEQRSTHGGYGSLVADLITETGMNARPLRPGVPEDAYTKNASAAFNRKFSGLDREGIAGKIRELLGKR